MVAREVFRECVGRDLGKVWRVGVFFSMYFRDGDDGICMFRFSMLDLLRNRGSVIFSCGILGSLAGNSIGNLHLSYYRPILDMYFASSIHNRTIFTLLTTDSL